jgi:hypothetical protein
MLVIGALRIASKEARRRVSEKARMTAHEA